MSYRKIAEVVGFSQAYVASYGQVCLPAELQGKQQGGGGQATVGEILPVEELVELRRGGLSYEAIGRLKGVSCSTVGLYAQVVLPRELRTTRRRKAGELGLSLGRVDDGTRPATEVAREVGCFVSSVVYWRQRREEKRAGARCERCSLLGERRNPVESGLCLWCRMEMQGEDLRAWCESGAPVRMGLVG